jgi:hypothetical protein
MIVEIERTEQIIDFAWELSRDSRSATYPRVERLCVSLGL